MPYAESKIKRLVDIAIAIALCPPVIAASVVSGVAIRMETKGSPLFLQERVGAAGQPFTLFKLRTMSVETPSVGTHEVDQRHLTRVGKLLRKTKVDELPQIFNVLRGDMSFVGPRPCLPTQAQVIEERSARGLSDLRPGITGPAQLLGIDMSRPVALAEADAGCVEAGIRTEVKWILQTFVGAGAGDPASLRLEDQALDE